MEGFDLFERLHEMADEQERENNMAHAILDLAGAPVREIIAAVVREFGDCDPVAVMRNAARRTLTAQDALMFSPDRHRRQEGKS